jgi:hypothetical protein
MTLRNRASLAAFGLGLSALLVLGCSGTPKFEPGCYMNSGVPRAVRRAVEMAADRFSAQLRSGQYEAAWSEGAEQLRNRVNKTDVALAWTQIAEILSIPDGLVTEEVVVVAIQSGHRGPRELACSDPADPGSSRRMVATDQPLQAYLIQTGVVRNVTYNFASVWFYEEGRWRVASFGTKPRKTLGHDWEHWAAVAREQRDKKQVRNAALLYNLAMDLLVPAPWVRPDQLNGLMAEQRQLRVENLPNNRKERWVATDGTEFFPFRSMLEPIPDGLAVKFQYEVPDGADSTQVAGQAPKLADFVRTTFPEYAEVFAEVHLEAVAAGDRRPVFAGAFPLK